MLAPLALVVIATVAADEPQHPVSLASSETIRHIERGRYVPAVDTANEAIATLDGLDRSAEGLEDELTHLWVGLAHAHYLLESNEGPHTGDSQFELDLRQACAVAPADYAFPETFGDLLWDSFEAQCRLLRKERGGRLVVRTFPEGSQLIIDGQSRAWRRPRLEQGAHLVQLVKPDGVDTQLIPIQKGRVVAVGLTDEPHPTRRALLLAGAGASLAAAAGLTTGGLVLHARHAAAFEHCQSKDPACSSDTTDLVGAAESRSRALLIGGASTGAVAVGLGLALYLTW